MNRMAAPLGWVIRPKLVLVGSKFGSLPMLAVEQVLRVDAQVDALSPGQVDAPAQAGVEHHQREAAYLVHTEREHTLLEVGRCPVRILLEAGVRVEPAIERRVVELDVVMFTVEEEVAPVQQPGGLPLERARELPVAEDRREHAAVIQERPAVAERQFPDAAGRDSVRTGVVALLPQGRLALVVVDADELGCFVYA